MAAQLAVAPPNPAPVPTVRLELLDRDIKNTGGVCPICTLDESDGQPLIGLRNGVESLWGCPTCRVAVHTICYERWSRSCNGRPTCVFRCKERR